MAGSSQSDTRSNFNKNGMMRGFYYGWATVPNETNKASIPQGYRPPYAWLLSPKYGGLSSVNNLVGVGVLSSVNLAGGLNASSTLVGSGNITNAAMGLILSAVATLVGSGIISSAAIVGRLDAAATLAGSGNITGSLGALASCIATLIGVGGITGGIVAKANLSADITPFTALSPENLAAAVWNALAAQYNAAGTMGNKMNSAAAAGNPWTDTSTYGAGTKGALLQDAADNAELAAIK